MAGLIGQYGSDSASSCAVHAMAATTSIWHQPKAASRIDLLRQRRAEAAADAQTDQKHREDERERIDGRAEQQPEQARPDHFAGERAEPRQRDREVHR